MALPKVPATRIAVTIGHVRRAVHDDRPFERGIIEAWVEPDQPETIAAAPSVGFSGHVEAQTGCHAAVCVRPSLGDLVSGAPSMGDVLPENQAFGGEIKNPKPPLARWQSVIDDRQEGLSMPKSMASSGEVRDQRSLQDNGVEVIGHQA